MTLAVFIGGYLLVGAVLSVFVSKVVKEPLFSLGGLSVLLIWPLFILALVLGVIVGSYKALKRVTTHDPR